MTYEEKKLIEAAKVLKKHCSGRPEEKLCDEYRCPFYNREDHKCKLWVDFLNDWDISKASRWTPLEQRESTEMDWGNCFGKMD